MESQSLRGSNVQSLTVTQPLFRGGTTSATVNFRENQVLAQRATLIGAEQTAFTNAVQAYVGVIQSQQVLALSIILIAMGFWRRSPRFWGQAYTANVVIMSAGFLLVFYQLTGLALS